MVNGIRRVPPSGAIFVGNGGAVPTENAVMIEGPRPERSHSRSGCGTGKRGGAE